MNASVLPEAPKAAHNADGLPVRYFLGLDIGQIRDPAVLSVLERPFNFTDPAADYRPPYDLRFLERFELGTSYVDVVARVISVLGKPPILGPENAPRAALVIDGTGVGRAVGDLLKLELAKAIAAGRARCNLREIVITYGHHFEGAPDHSLHVPKKELVSTLQILLQGRRLRMPPDLKHGATLVRELENFKIKIMDAMKEKFESAREGLNDDIVLSCAMAAWTGEQVLRAEIKIARTPKEPPEDPWGFRPVPYGR